MGQGDIFYHDSLLELKKQYPYNIGLHLLSDFVLPRQIFSGADVLLMPSNFEPGGIVAIEALRYGAVPVVRRTGGLSDIIIDFDAGSLKGNGFSFKNRSAWSLYGAIVRGLCIFEQTEIWNKLTRNAMSSDFSWKKASQDYHDWYELVRKRYK